MKYGTLKTTHNSLSVQEFNTPDRIAELQEEIRYQLSMADFLGLKVTVVAQDKLLSAAGSRNNAIMKQNGIQISIYITK